jgi:UDP-N-acetylglucosamine--N-acetylmuramyl-(pentapeptide) pyrophosphoryl-undecaprenol N-acetylglucosamine transferase
VHLAFPEARDFLPRRARRRARVSGNPVREPAPVERTAARKSYGLDPEGQVALVVGGSQGSASLNRLILEGVASVEEGRLRRLPGLQILWVTGPEHLDQVEGELRSLGSPGWVRPVGYIHEMPIALAAATLAISRAGAMTTSEFLAWGIPAILVPLPSAAANHQTLNAESLERAGAALHLPQPELTGARLWESATALLGDRGRLEAMSAAALSRGNPHASREIARELVAILPPAPEEDRS